MVNRPRRSFYRSQHSKINEVHPSKIYLFSAKTSLSLCTFCIFSFFYKSSKYPKGNTVFCFLRPVRLIGGLYCSRVVSSTPPKDFSLNQDEFKSNLLYDSVKEQTLFTPPYSVRRPLCSLLKREGLYIGSEHS